MKVVNQPKSVMYMMPEPFLYIHTPVHHKFKLTYIFLSLPLNMKKKPTCTIQVGRVYLFKLQKNLAAMSGTNKQQKYSFPKFWLCSTGTLLSPIRRERNNTWKVHLYSHRISATTPSVPSFQNKHIKHESL